MARIRVDVSQDRMLAHLSVVAGEPGTLADLDAALDRSGVRFGVDEAIRQRVGIALAQPNFVMSREVVATGVPPVRGQDGVFETAFEVGIHLRDDGTLDFLDRDLVKLVRAGEPVGWLTAPDPGLSGRRVDGAEVTASGGRACPVRLGPNLTEGPGGSVLARCDGAVAYVADRSIDVVRHLDHKGDVDLRTGHVETEGSITVSGSVAPDFVVRASGDIDVKGTCDGAQLFAGGHVRVGGLVRGGACGGVTAGGDVHAGAAESVEVNAGGAISVRYAVHAELRGASITVTKQIRGGYACAEHHVIVGDAGSVAGAVTMLEAGVPVRSPADVRAAVARAKAYRHLASARGETRGKGGKVGRASAELAREAMNELERARQRELLLATAYVEVRGTLFPGARICLGDLQYEVDWDAHAVRVSFDTNARALRIEHTGTK